MRTLLLVSLLTLAACSRPEAPPKPTPAAPVAVTTAAIAVGPVVSSYDATGTVRASVTATVSARLMGYAKEVRVRVGDHVAEGQLLVLLDARDQETGVRQAEAAREELRLAIPEADSAVAGAKAQSELAELTLQRLQDLFQKRSVTQQELDEAIARRKAAQSAFDMARARRSQLNAKLTQAEQGLHLAGLQQGYARVTAPFAGLITTRTVEPGTLTMPGMPLFTLERDGAFRLEANVEESRLGSIRLGQSLPVFLGDASTPQSGRVSEIVPLIDAATRTGIVKIDLPAVPGLRSGLFGRASFAATGREAPLVPLAALVERGQLQSVFVAEGSTARLRLVTLGARTAMGAEVLSGLSPHETVISPVPPGLLDGAAIEVRR